MMVLNATDVINVFTFFYSGNVFLRFLKFFYFFPRFLFLKNFVKCKVWICKSPTKNTLRGCLSDDLYWFWFFSV